MVVQNRWLRHGFICAGAWLFILICLSCLPAIAAEKAAAPAQVTWNIPHLTQPPRIDGELSEWANIVPVFLGVEKDQIRYYSLRPWAGPLDSSARIWMGWDKDNLYFAADIRDDTFRQASFTGNELEDFWSGDSLWLTVASPDKTKQNGTVERLKEINWAITRTGALALFSKGGTNCRRADALPVSAHTKTDGTGWICEGAIPWKEIPFSAHPGALMRLSWAAGDSDISSKAFAVPISDIGANIDPKDLYLPDLVGLLWPRSVGSYYQPWNFALATLTDAPPPGDNKFAGNAMEQEYKRLIAYYRTTKDSQHAEALLWTGHTCAFFGERESAKAIYRQIIEKFPNDSVSGKAILGLASIAGVNMEDTNEIEGFFVPILKAHADSYVLGNVIALRLARLTLLKNNLDTMSKNLNYLANKVKGHRAEKGILAASAKFPLEDGIAKSNDGAFLQAAQEIEFAIKQKSLNAEDRFRAFQFLGNCYMGMNSFSEAIPNLEEALKANEAQARAGGVPYLLGFSYYRLGKYVEARKIFREILTREPENPAIESVKDHIRRCDDALKSTDRPLRTNH
jgi:tetratricopeptide (TPR) repeat protein